MGLNWAAGLNALGDGIGEMAKSAGQDEHDAAVAAREENLMRLKAKLDEDAQGRLFKQQDDLQGKRDAAAAEREDKRWKAYGDREASRDRQMHADRMAEIGAAADRQDRQLAAAGERDARREDDTRRRDALKQIADGTSTRNHAIGQLNQYIATNALSGVGQDFSGLRKRAATDETLKLMLDQYDYGTQQMNDGQMNLSVAGLNGFDSIPGGRALPNPENLMQSQDLIAPNASMQQRGASLMDFGASNDLIPKRR